MLQNFRIARCRLTYTVQEPLKMPQYKDTVCRSRLGYTLRQSPASFSLPDDRESPLISDRFLCIKRVVPTLSLQWIHGLVTFLSPDLIGAQLLKQTKPEPIAASGRSGM